MASLRWISTRTLLVGLVIGGSVWAGVLAHSKPSSELAGKEGGPAAIDPQSDALLKKMAAYLTSVRSFTVRATNTLQVILVTGEKLDFEAVSDVSVRRPDRLLTRRRGLAVNADFFYDGKTVTVFDRPTKFFTVTEAPPTIDGMAARLQDMLGAEVPGADLLYSDLYEGLIAEVTQAQYVAIEDVGGVRAHHLAFRAREVDWQIWIEDGERPLPRRYVITTKWMTGSPQFGVTLSDWDLSAQLDDKTFTFDAPTGARKVEVLKPAIPTNR